jgi:hypothetical protein
MCVMKLITSFLCLPLLIALGSFAPPGPAPFTAGEPTVAVRPIAFNGQTYRLSLSSQPSAGHLRQEYLPATEAASAYRDLFMLTLVTTGLTVDEAVQMQVQKLTKIQEEDLTVNYKVVRDPRTGATVLDFVWRAYSTDDRPMIEWNAYRFEAHKTPTGQQGVLMVGNRRRAYGSDIVPFLNAFRTERPRVLDSLRVYKMPMMQLAVN